MGSGAWSAASFFDRAQSKAAAGRDTFDYSKRAQESGTLVVHPSLDPNGLGVRESRDSVEHPDSNAILVSLDVTGSMGKVVRAIHADLPRLHELLLGQKYIPHPQILFAAVGDATCDRVPLQVGQFESDNRMDENLEHMILEGGGGGQKTESYELTLYIAARHTAMDCYEKRNRKGYLFMIGDELAYPKVMRAHVHRLVGVDPEADIPLEQIMSEVKAKFHFYFIIPGGAANGQDKQVVQFWQHYAGVDHVIALHDPSDTAECIATTIGVNEGVITLDHAAQQMHAQGKPIGVIDRILHAIGSIFSGKSKSDTTMGTRRL